MTVLAKVFSLYGRMRRRDYWLCRLGVAVTVFALIVAITATAIAVSPEPRNPTPSEGRPVDAILGLLILLILFVWSWTDVALGVKRLHDRDQSGWMTLLIFVPFGAIYLFVVAGFLDGTQGPNRFGPSPKGIGEQQQIVDSIFG